MRSRALGFLLALIFGISGLAGAQLITGGATGPAGGAIGGSGTIGNLPVFSAAQTLGNSIVSQSGAALTVAGSITATSPSAFGAGIQLGNNAPFVQGYYTGTTNAFSLGAVTSPGNFVAGSLAGDAVLRHDSGRLLFARSTSAIDFIVDASGNITGATFIAPALGTPASGVATNLTGTAAGLTAGNASLLNGATFAAPGPIGGGTPGSGAFTTVGIGIGTSVPLTKLQVGLLATTGGNMPGASTAITLVSTLPSDLNGTSQLALIDDSGITAGQGGGISFNALSASNTTGVIGSLRVFRENSTSGDFSGAMQLATRVGAGANTERMRITSVGFVGIGTASPSGTLHVVPAANTVPLTISGGSTTGSGTTGLFSASHTLNTSGVVHADDRAYTVTAAGAGSTLFRIRGGAGGATAAFSIATDGGLTSAGHIQSSTTAPAVSNTSANSCGTTAATIVGTDVAGKVTVGATAGTSCTVTFTTTWTNAPACMVTNETTANLSRATSTTTTAILAGTFVAGDVLAYMCLGRV